MRWFIKVLCLVLFSALSAISTALDINLSRYNVYEADLNGDGKLDYYFQGKQLIIPIHGDIIIPIVLPAPANLTIYSYGNQYFVPVEESYTEVELLIKFLQPSSASSSSLQTVVANATVPRFDFNAQAPAEFKYSLAISGVPDLGISQLVAATQGKLSVANGAANFSIDINLPPAVRDLKPTLALAYSSRSGNGSMGVGWSLSGLSAITRCNSNFATEGAEAKESNPRYTVGDRLCLDGQKMVVASIAAPATNAIYWATSAEYKTEKDNFSKIVAYGSSANGGHGYFKVWTKDGRILTFGEADIDQNSKVYSSTTTTSPVSSWLLDKVEDVYGNNYTISYTNDLSSGDSYPQRINFAPNSAVVFNYQDRQGQIPWGYSKGNHFKRNKVLDTVTTYINVTTPSLPESATPVRRYDVDYVLSQATQRELVNTITECGYQSSSWKCAKPLAFDWQQGEFGFDVDNPFRLQYCSGGFITDAVVQVVDLDGDDRNDIIMRNGKIAWGSAGSCFDNGDWVTSGYTLEASSPLMTFNGYALLVQWTDTTVTPNKKVIGLINNINRANSTKTYTEIDRDSTDVGSFMISDLNNDGLDDFYYKGIKFTQAYQSTPTFVQTGLRSISKSAGTVLLDIYGDGLKSRITTDVNYSTTNGLPVGVFVVFPSGASFEANTTKLYTVAEPFKDRPIQQPGGMYRTVADINGDGNKDFLYHQVTGNTGHWFYRINKQNGSIGTQVATGLVAAKSGQSYQVYNHYSYAYDYDQDGREDLLTIVPEGPNVCKLRVLLARDNNGDSVNFVEAKDSSGNQIAFLANIGACTPVYNETQSHILIGDFNNDGSLDISYSGIIYPGKQKQPDLLVSITDGFDAQTKIGYSTLISNTSQGQLTYVAGTKPVFPQTTSGRNIQVVSSTETSNGAGGYSYSSYLYTGARMDRQGRGFLGFESINTINHTRGVVTFTEYLQNWPYTGRIKKQTVKASNGDLISTVSNTYEVHTGNSRFPYLKTVLQKNYGLLAINESSPIGVSKTTNVFDTCGNLLDKTVKVGAGISGTTITSEISNQHIVNDYDYNGTDGNCTDDFFEKTSQEVSKSGGAELKSVITEFSPNDKRDIYSRIDFKDSTIQKTTIFDRETNGVISKITERAKDFDNTNEPDRVTASTDFLSGLYPQTITTAENHSTALTYDARFGLVQTETFLGQPTINTYDALGRLQSQKTPDGTLTENISFYCNSSSPVTCPTSAKYGVASRVTNGSQNGMLGEPLSIVFYDSLQREIRSMVYGLGGKVVNKVTEYTASGYVHRVSEPYVTRSTVADSNGATNWTTFSNYDVLGRANLIASADGGSKTTTYTTDSYGLKISSVILVSKPNSSTETQTAHQWLNTVGDVIRVEDALNGIVTYGYDAMGNLEATQVGNSTATKIDITHDIAGNKTYIKDPDAGPINFDFNGFGELRRQTWQKDVSGIEKYITYDYDKLGRQTSRIDRPASGSAVSYSWVWDTKQQGQLSYRTGNGFHEEYFYDGFSRLSRQVVTAGGLSNGEFIYTYDSFSRPETIRYPNGYKIQRDYHAAGYQVQTREMSSSGILWAMGNTLDARGNFNNQLWGNGVVTQTVFDSASGQLTNIKSGRLSSTNNFSSLFGDIQNLSYTYDSLGNLASRATARTNANGVALENITESYSYDKLNRLKTITTSGLFARTQTFDYDIGGLGNLINRSDVLSGSSINNDVGEIKYDQVRNAGVHAVTSAGGVNYSYDRYGNMISRGGETVVYDTFNKPTRITGASITDFYYDPDHELYKEIRGTKVVYKLAGGTYEVIVDGATTTQKSYVDGVILNTRTLVNGVQNANDTAYLHTDHLGSVEATTNALGQFVNRMSFGAWGERQKSDWKPGVPAENFLTSSGFTGHHQLDSHNLIHMGGRVYDPNIGRFLSADLFVQSPYNSQSFNRYSYTFNNPGSFVDPSGYMCTTHYFHNYYRNENGSSDYLGLSTQQTCDGNDFYNKPGYDNGYENIQLPQLASVLDFGVQNSTGIVAPLTGNSFYGAAAVLVEEASLGIIWGENGTILALRSNPQIEANKTAALNGAAGPALRAFSLVAAVAGSGKFVKGGSLFTSNPSRVFWSGSTDAKRAAESFAKLNKAVTLEVTLTGRALQAMTNKYTYNALKPLWERASEKFARGAQGGVDVFQSAKGVRIESVWATKEYPIISQQGNLINFHVVP